jgi:hypothetical protein
LHEFVNRRVTEFFVCEFRDGADVLDAMAGEELESLVRSGPALAAEFHQGTFAVLRRLARERKRRGWHECASRSRGGKDEISSVHCEVDQKLVLLIN